MARKNPKIFRQNGDGPDQKGLRSPACGAELPRFRVDKDGSQGDRLTPTRCTRPQGRVRIETNFGLASRKRVALALRGG